MRWRTWIALLAVAGLLANAAALVRHHAMMTAQAVAALAVAPLNAAKSIDTELASTPICHAASGPSEGAAPSRTGGAPEPDRNNNDGKTKCPICTGLVSAFVLTASESSVLPMPAARPLTGLALADQRVGLQKRIRPPSRGPPLAA